MRHKRVGFLAGVVTVACALVSCGGGGSGGPSEISVTLQSVSSHDGSVFSDGLVLNASLPSVGDDHRNVRIQGFLSFDLSPIYSAIQKPRAAPGADGTAPAAGPPPEPPVEVVRAILFADQVEVTNDPFGIGHVAVHPVVIGDALDASDYAILLGIPDTFLSMDASLVRKQADVTEMVKSALAGARATADFRLTLEHSSDNDGQTDLVQFLDAEHPATPGTPPVLLVTWKP